MPSDQSRSNVSHPGGRSVAAPPVVTQSPAERWATALAPFGVALFAFVLYWAGAAPGITWAHQGADGGELLAAALTNGVPHPPGYPLYILLLQGWLWLTGIAFPGAEPIYRVAVLSALCAAASVGFTQATARHLLRTWPYRHLWATLAALAWAVCPLLWAQAVIAEVYALHTLLFVLLGWVVLVHPRQLWYVVLLVALGVAHHLTFVLLLPAALLALWAQRDRQRPGRNYLLRLVGVFALGGVLGALFYLRTPWVAGMGPPPVNWGYPDNWDGFWWLVSGAAYRGYLLGAPEGTILTRVAAWAYTVAVQYTPIGLALALVGLATWDRETPWLRNFSLAWLAPVSVYAIIYYTRDSDIYLLPVAWIMALWLAVGLAVAGVALCERLPDRRRSVVLLLGATATLGLLALLVWRWPQLALGGDVEARTYLDQVAAIVPPDGVVVTTGDKETFAVWYGTWGNGSLAAQAPGVLPVNASLYQFDWYRRLQGDLHPDVPGISESVEALIAANRGRRPIFFAERPSYLPEDAVEPAGPLWRLK